jgi:hypothetical protein
MKNSKLFFVLILLIASTVNAQLTKGNWLLGGTGYFSYSKSNDKQQPSSGSLTISNSSAGAYDILLEPSIGYFVKNRFALGLKLNYRNGYTEGTSFSIKTSTLGISPFVRYYFLNEEKNFNIFFEPAYFYEINNTLGNSNAFSLKVGHVIFFNSSVGFETSINYIKGESKQFTSDRIFIGLGVQIHLEKK